VEGSCLIETNFMRGQHEANDSVSTSGTTMGIAVVSNGIQNTLMTSLQDTLSH
jgi:hypothetical protein